MLMGSARRSPAVVTIPEADHRVIKPAMTIASGLNPAQG
jgi:hypothetical protein